MNRASEFHIDFPQPTANNLSERRAAFYATLPNRMDIPFMTRSEAMELMGPAFPVLEPPAIIRRIIANKQLFRHALRFAAATVGALLALLSFASLR